MTNQAGAPRPRYDEGCLAAHALNQIGDRWALLVVRELMFAPKRFQMIRAGIPGITASVLTARLGQLQQAGVIAHDERLGIYALTEAGRGVLPVLEALCRWALTLPGHDATRFISPSALMISMGVNLQRSPAGPDTLVGGFDFTKESFEARVVSGRLETLAVERPEAPFVLKADGNAMASALYGSQPLVQLAGEGVVEVQGDIAAAQRFVDLFSLVPRA